MNKVIFVTAMSIVLAPSLVIAKQTSINQGVDYKGPIEISEVASLLKETNFLTDKDVVVEGVLSRQVNHDTFIFSDGSGEIQVELDDDITLMQPLDSETHVRLFGEYEGGSTPEIEVERIHVL
ncbi:NirD/YgiW/YdeI family stress tolerance protein [Vibrio sp. JPW-9-11-11]|uniref:YgiW/YdeI family stress tolerance OB fold protein n=1 Tax=Vibrio sp. JPW-9-11-11 TaxID=1416532 RepID=UPI0015948DC0|nr:NirD/YgiW/YdeI family stress tolerance protein [Vibrio sp. JPW-9-11-11]NVD07879.1 NirD/YgiW/YdeI family stress tolerance protein [Vibrio sp. JPW-9-11-11]